MVRRLKPNSDYGASPLEESDSPTPVHGGSDTGGRRGAPRAAYANRGYFTDDADEGRGTPTRPNRRDRAPPPPRAPSALSVDTGSEIYVTSAVYKTPSEYSRYSRRPTSRLSGPASVRSMRSVRSRPGVTVEAMTAPNPFCPNIKGMCCLMLLLNLGLILVTLGFVIVIQFFEPIIVWILGIVFLVFGFLTLIGSLIYCVVLCRESPPIRDPEDLYWTHHWQKSFGNTPSRRPEIHYRAEDKYGDADRYSDRYSVSKMSAKYSDNNRY